MTDRDWRAIMGQCERWLGPRRPASAAEVLNAAAAALPQDALSDQYGEGEYVEAFERRIADLFGKQAAVLMPSGTMAQQIALRIHAIAAGAPPSRFTRPAISSSMSTPATPTCMASRRSCSAIVTGCSLWMTSRR